MHKKKKNYFNFSHEYFKLKKSEFTTIRGKKAIKFFEINDIVSIFVKREKKFEAKIVNIKQKCISELDLKVLKEDGEYPGLELENKEDFIKLLNSFSSYSKIKKNDLLTIFYLKRI